MKKGDIIDGFFVKKLLGEGGFGQVWIVEKEGIEYALKQCTSIEEEDKARFHREYRLLSSLISSNVITVHHVGEDSRGPYYVMDKGEISLKDIVLNGLSFSNKANYSLQICLGLKFLHDNNVYHRDIKPENIIIKDGIPKWIDFGIGRFINRDTATITSTADVFGSYGYVAPEIAEGGFKHFSKESDIYSLGGVLYYIFSDASIPFCINPKYVPADIFPIIDKCRKPDSDDRYHDAYEVYLALQSVINARSSISTIAEVYKARASLSPDELVTKTLSLFVTTSKVSEMLDKFNYINAMWDLLTKANSSIADALIPTVFKVFSEDSSPWLQFYEIDYLSKMVANLYNGTNDIVSRNKLMKIGVSFAVGYNRWEAMKTIFNTMIKNIDEKNVALYRDTIQECSDELWRLEDCFGHEVILPDAVKRACRGEE